MDSAGVYDEKFEVYASGVNPVILKHLKPKQSVLDLGCSDGALGNKIKQLFGSLVYGVDISPRAIGIAKEKLDKAVAADISCGTLPFPENLFDVIIFADVLEHVCNPGEVLISMSKYLKIGGVYLISFPNIANWSIRMKLLLGRFDYTEQGILDRTHIRFFTLKSMSELLRRAGFSMEKVDCLRGALVVLGIQRFLAKIHLHWLYIGFDNFMCRLWKTMFAQQFVILARRREK